jgi:predicted secreted protein
MKEVTREIVCDLDERELAEVAQRLGLTTLNIDVVEAERAEQAKGYREKLAGLRESARKLSTVLQSRSEVKPVECLVMFHTPAQGTKRVVRKDTGEIYRDEPMTALELQQNLFGDEAKGDA